MEYDESYPEYPQSPEPIRSGSFTYGKDGFAAGGISREPLPELKLLFRKNASRARVGVANKTWVTAQLRLYGIPFQRTSSAAQLKATLEDAVRTGKCNAIELSIATLERSLSEKYQQRLDSHSKDVNRWKDIMFSSLNSPTQEANFDLDRFMAKYFLDNLHGQPAREKTKEPLVLESGHDAIFQEAVKAIPGLAAHITHDLTVVGWETDLQRGVDTAFAGLSSPDAEFDIPTREANFDIDRFLAKYFLSGLNGKPAPSKTPNPICLGLFFKHIYKLQIAVASIPGLNLCTAEGLFSSMYSKYTIIGWNPSKIKLRVREIEDEKARYDVERAAEKLAERQKRWQEIMQPHLEYKKSHQAIPGTLTLGHLSGSYVVRSQSFDEYYDDKREIMTLNIMQPSSIHGTQAKFDFGLIEGTMLLALSHDALELLRLEVDVDSEDEESDSDDYVGNGKRKKESNNSTNQRPVKRRLGENPVPNRVYFRWAGRETGEGEIQVDRDNEHTGYLDFNEGKTSARGEFYYPMFFGDEKLELEIFKVADRPSGGTPERWSSFSEKRWDYESVARWH